MSLRAGGGGTERCWGTPGVISPTDEAAGPGTLASKGAMKCRNCPRNQNKVALGNYILGYVFILGACSREQHPEHHIFP